MQRGNIALILLVAFLLIGILVGGLIFYQSQKKTPLVINQKVLTTPVPTPLVLTYLDSTFGFKFSYPALLIVKSDSESDYNLRNGGDARKDFNSYVQYEPPQIASASAVVAKTQKLNNAPFLIWIFENPLNLNEMAWFEKYWYYPFLWGQFETAEKAKLAPSKEVSIDQGLVKYGEVAYQAGSPKYYLIPKDQKMILIRVLEGEEGAKILKTFSASAN